MDVDFKAMAADFVDSECELQESGTIYEVRVQALSQFVRIAVELVADLRRELALAQVEEEDEPEEQTELGKVRDLRYEVEEMRRCGEFSDPTYTQLHRFLNDQINELLGDEP